MMRAQTSKKQFTMFVIGVFALGWILQIIASIFVNRGENTVFRVIMAVCMYMPLLSVLIAGIPLKGMGFIPHLKGKKLQYHT